VPAARHRLDIVVPGLFVPQPGLANLSSAERPDWRLLETWLARADRWRGPARKFESLLAERLGLTGDNLSLAAVTAAADGLAGKTGWWLRADPVCLLPDRDRLRLVDASPVLTAAEAGSLAATLNDFLADDGLEIVVPHPQRWYLRCERGCTTGGSPLPEVSGEDIAPHLPAADDGTWRRRLNAIQMCLHGHPVNAARETEGLLPVNSVWFWGGGRWPERTGSDISRIFTDDDLFVALGEALGLERRPLRALATADLTGNSLVIDTRLWPAHVQRDPLAWMERVTEFNDEIVSIVTKRMREDDLSIRLHGAGGNLYTIQSRQRFRLWRRRRFLPELTAS